MAKQSILTNKKILWSSIGILLTSGVMAGILVPVLTSKDDPKEKDTKLTLSREVLNAKTSDETITAMQKLYGLEIKKASAVNNLEPGELKTKYQSASNLATFIFANKNSYKTLFVLGKEQTTNLQEIVMIMSPKNLIREQTTTGNWPGNQVDAQDQFNFLITFFKGKVVKVRQLNAKTAVVNEAKIFFKTKAYDLVNLFYDFKNADPQASDFGYYNAYLDDKNNTQGLALFKKYLLTLKTQDSTITNVDLTEVQFTKKSHSTATNTATAKLRFSYQGLSTTKTINDFQYKLAYKLTLKARVKNKMADEVEREDIDTTNLPPGVSISNIEPSPDYPDGSVIKITFRGGTITSQNLHGLTSYQVKAQALLESTQNSDFTITRKSEILPSAYNDKDTLWRQLQKKADIVANNNAKRKVKEILGKANITFEANDQTGVLSFTITIGAINKTFVIGNFSTFINHINKRIDDEVARRTKPTIKPGSEWKSVFNILNEDIIIVPSDVSLQSKVIDKEWNKKENIFTRGSVLIVTIQVFSPIVGTKTKNYQVNLNMPTLLAFSEIYDYGFRAASLHSSDFVISNKENILPSQFSNIQMFKNVIKKNLEHYQKSISNSLELLKKIVNNNFKVVLIPNDNDGSITVKYKFGSKNWSLRISGFKTSS